MDKDNFATPLLSSTDDHRRFSTLSVHLYIQHNGRDAARRVDSSPAVQLFFLVL